ncbi:MAG: prepilin-type N-terminal cleavage/methylation domain-containing protein [Thermodesulfobacteriota bacterium]
MTPCIVSPKVRRALAPPGFTLMELMVVIALLGTIFFITIPRIGRTVSVSDLDESARALAAKLSAARERALATGKEQLLLVDMANRQIRSIEAEKKNELALSPEPAGDGFRLPGDVTVSDIQWSDGSTQATGTAEILVTREGYARYSAVHFADGDLRLTVFLEPFLSGVRIVRDYEAMEPTDS